MPYPLWPNSRAARGELGASGFESEPRSLAWVTLLSSNGTRTTTGRHYGYQGPMTASGEARVGACIGIVPENFRAFMDFSRFSGAVCIFPWPDPESRPITRMSYSMMTSHNWPDRRQPRPNFEGTFRAIRNWSTALALL